MDDELLFFFWILRSSLFCWIVDPSFLQKHCRDVPFPDSGCMRHEEVLAMYRVLSTWRSQVKVISAQSVSECFDCCTLFAFVVARTKSQSRETVNPGGKEQNRLVPVIVKQHTPIVTDFEI